MHEKRLEPRITYNALSLPFLGARISDGMHFQFLLIDASKSGIQISIPDWVVAWDQFVKDDEVKLCLPVLLGNSMLELCKVCWKKTDAVTQEQHLGLVQQTAETRKPLFVINDDGTISLAGSSFYPRRQEIVLKLIKDSVILKRGIKICLEHFSPYFARIAKDSEHFDEMRQFMLDDTLALVGQNVQKLELLLKNLKDGTEKEDELSSTFDMGALQKVFQSEIYQGVFKQAFPDETLLNYVEEIKKLESRLFHNYNSLIILHVMSLEEAFS